MALGAIGACGHPLDSDNPDMCSGCAAKVVNIETPYWRIAGLDDPNEPAYEPPPPPAIEPGATPTVAQLEAYGEYIDYWDRGSIYRHGAVYYRTWESFDQPWVEQLKPGQVVGVGNHEAGDKTYFEVPKE